MAEKLRREQGLPPDPGIVYSRALVYHDQGNREKACELARQARDMYEGSIIPVHPNILAFIEEECSDSPTQPAPPPDA